MTHDNLLSRVIALVSSASLAIAAIFVCAIFVCDRAALAQQPPPSVQPAKPHPQAPSTQASVPPSAGAQPLLLGQYSNWGAYVATPAGKKICFALAKPVDSQTNPANRPRDPVYMFISSRPAEKVKDEVSIIMGYGFKPNADATISLGSTNFAMYTQNDGAWIKNAAEEARLVDAMRKGSDLVVKGVSAHGTQTTDTYSLQGVVQALDRAAQECR
jgi:invasion protein IalB